MPKRHDYKINKSNQLVVDLREGKYFGVKWTSHLTQARARARARATSRRRGLGLGFGFGLGVGLGLGLGLGLVISHSSGLVEFGRSLKVAGAAVWWYRYLDTQPRTHLRYLWT